MKKWEGETSQGERKKKKSTTMKSVTNHTSLVVG